MDIQVVNINRLSFTKNVVNDLSRQTGLYKLRLVDQGSTEEGTREYLSSLGTEKHIEVIMNTRNVDVYRLWNSFYEQTTGEFLCFLNNDIRLPSNFVKDTMDIFRLEPTVGCVIHSTNHSDYQKVTPLNYVILSNSFGQGWDCTFRRSSYTLVPNELKLFYGDDFVFINLYRDGWKVAIALSSPIIHFTSTSCKNSIDNENDLNRGIKWMRDHGYGRLRHRCDYTRGRPEFLEIKE
ncbi:MAG: glycosyltransferase [bacterium]